MLFKPILYASCENENASSQPYIYVANVYIHSTRCLIYITLDVLLESATHSMSYLQLWYFETISLISRRSTRTLRRCDVYSDLCNVIMRADCVVPTCRLLTQIGT